MPFHHKNIRLHPENYVGKNWFFITLCCANRCKLFTTAKFCDWFLNILRRDAARHSFAVYAYCLMPDHVHLLLEGREPTSDLLLFVKALKTKTSTPFEGKTGHPLWQKKFYDHILRRNDSPDAVAWYIWMNPVRAGFCGSPEEYPFLGSFTGTWSTTHMPSSAWSPPWQKTKRPRRSGAATRALASDLLES
jgi:putative transposase